MNGFIYNLPWTTPGPVGLVLGTGFAPLAFFLAALLLLVDLVIYYPFFKSYDNLLLEKEGTQTLTEQEEAEVPELNVPVIHASLEQKLAVLVLCANGATSGMLANAITKGADQKQLDLTATAMAYGQHKNVIGDFDLIILAPQMSSMPFAE